MFEFNLAHALLIIRFRFTLSACLLLKNWSQLISELLKTKNYISKEDNKIVLMLLLMKQMKKVFFIDSKANAHKEKCLFSNHDEEKKLSTDKSRIKIQLFTVL